MTSDNSFGIEASSPPSPRAIGWIWVLYFLTGILGTLLTKGIVVTTDAAATANNILAHASLYRAGFAVDFSANLIYIALTALLFGLFRPVNPILRSTFLPKWIGWWWIAGGVGGLTFLWSPLATVIWPLLVAAGAGEFVLPVWLLVKGVDNSKWRGAAA